MKYKLFVVGEATDGTENEVVTEIAASDEFTNLSTLIEQLDLFGTEWEVTEYGVTVFGSDWQPTKK
jgi:hypothetical protein